MMAGFPRTSIVLTQVETTRFIMALPQKSHSVTSAIFYLSSHRASPDSSGGEYTSV